MQRLRSSLATASSGSPGVDTTAAAAQPILELPVVSDMVPCSLPHSIHVLLHCPWPCLQPAQADLYCMPVAFP
jgi:hypothetical protein